MSSLPDSLFLGWGVNTAIGFNSPLSLLRLAFAGDARFRCARVGVGDSLELGEEEEIDELSVMGNGRRSRRPRGIGDLGAEFAPLFFLLETSARAISLRKRQGQLTLWTAYVRRAPQERASLHFPPRPHLTSRASHSAPWRPLLHRPRPATPLHSLLAD